LNFELASNRCVYIPEQFYCHPKIGVNRKSRSDLYSRRRGLQSWLQLGPCYLTIFKLFLSPQRKHTPFASDVNYCAICKTPGNLQDLISFTKTFTEKQQPKAENRKVDVQ